MNWQVSVFALLMVGSTGLAQAPPARRVRPQFDVLDARCNILMYKVLLLIASACCH